MNNDTDVMFGCVVGFVVGVIFVASWIWAAAHVVIR